jgi:ATP-dependent 26S proteasome regulatory subunit
MSTSTLQTSNLQSMMQFELLNKLRTGDPIMDAMISIMIFSGIGGLLTSGGSVLTWINGQRLYIFHCLYLLFIKIYYKLLGKDNYMRKEISIEYITDNKNINELYKAMNWYLSNSVEIDYKKETPLKLSFEEKIEPNNAKTIKDPKLNKFMTRDIKKHIMFKDFKIYYVLSQNVMTVYTDKERKRENYSIQLYTDIRKDAKTDILEEFCIYCLDKYIKSMITKQWEQLIYVNKNGKWEPQKSNNRRKIDTIVLQHGLKEDIQADLSNFLASEDWYYERDVPYTRGYLFYGHPGTGKTSMIKGIANMSKRHMHYLMLNNIQNDTELFELLKTINYKETILIIEDIDCMTDIIKDRNTDTESNGSIDVVNKDELKEVPKDSIKDKLEHLEKQVEQSKQKLTLSGLLNAIDGIFNNDGRILIMTTNHPEIIDDALIRPGRIDCQYLYDYCNREQIRDLYKSFFDKDCDEKLLNNIEHRKYSPAHITNLFLQYRNNPEEALYNINKINHKIIIEPLIK